MIASLDVDRIRTVQPDLPLNSQRVPSLQNQLQIVPPGKSTIQPMADQIQYAQKKNLNSDLKKRPPHMPNEASGQEEKAKGPICKKSANRKPLPRRNMTPKNIASAATMNNHETIKFSKNASNIALYNTG